MYSLPELNHRRRGVGVGDVGGVFSVVVDAVLCGDAKGVTRGRAPSSARHLLPVFQ